MANRAGTRPQPQAAHQPRQQGAAGQQEAGDQQPQAHPQQRHTANEAAAFLAHLLQSHPHMDVQQAGQQHHHAFKGMP